MPFIIPELTSLFVRIWGQPTFTRSTLVKCPASIPFCNSSTVASYRSGNTFVPEREVEECAQEFPRNSRSSAEIKKGKRNIAFGRSGWLGKGANLDRDQPICLWLKADLIEQVPTRERVPEIHSSPTPQTHVTRYAVKQMTTQPGFNELQPHATESLWLMIVPSLNGWQSQSPNFRSWVPISAGSDRDRVVLVIVL